MTTQVDTICEALNNSFIQDGPTFTMTELWEDMLRCHVSYPSLVKTISSAMKSGYLTAETDPGDRRKKIYYILSELEPEVIKRELSVASLRAKFGETDLERYSYERHPSKRHVTDHFYSTYGALDSNTISILSLCGPNVMRFINNSLKISDPDTTKIDLVECSERTSRHIQNQLSSYKGPLPKINLHTIKLQDFHPTKSHQFQELDCEGSWKLLYPTYERMLKAQAFEASLRHNAKGMIVTVFGRQRSNAELDQNLASLLTNIGVRFKDTENMITDPALRKTFRGNWKYVHLYDTFPNMIDAGRLLKLQVYKYSQSGCQMFSSLLIYA
jgi:DNA-binding PadR family transcriptional regulator